MCAVSSTRKRYVKQLTSELSSTSCHLPDLFLQDMTIERLLTIFPTVKVPPFRPSSKVLFGQQCTHMDTRVECVVFILLCGIKWLCTFDSCPHLSEMLWTSAEMLSV